MRKWTHRLILLQSDHSRLELSVIDSNHVQHPVYICKTATQQGLPAGVMMPALNQKMVKGGSTVHSTLLHLCSCFNIMTFAAACYMPMTSVAACSDVMQT